MLPEVGGEVHSPGIQRTWASRRSSCYVTVEKGFLAEQPAGLGGVQRCSPIPRGCGCEKHTVRGGVYGGGGELEIPCTFRLRSQPVPPQIPRVPERFRGPHERKRD